MSKKKKDEKGEGEKREEMGGWRCGPDLGEEGGWVGCNCCEPQNAMQWRKNENKSKLHERRMSSCVKGRA